MANYPIGHIEIPSENSSVSGAFYRNVFGWKTETNQEHNYTLFQAEGFRGGFARPDEPAYKQDRLMVYLATDDIDGTLATVEAHGGKIVHPRTEIPHVGCWAIFTDPSGNSIGLYTRYV